MEYIRKCKCKVCGKPLTTDIAYRGEIEDKHFYFCNELEFIGYHYRTTIRKYVKELIDALFGYRIIHGYLYSEWKRWNEKLDDANIADIINGKFEELSQHIRCDGEILSNSVLPKKIAYLSSVIMRVADSLDYVEHFQETHPDLEATTNKIKNMDYAKFLNTKFWKSISEYMKYESFYKCKKCGKQGGKLVTHHKTYERHGYEYLPEVMKEDLVVLCDKCHKDIHGKSYPS